MRWGKQVVGERRPENKANAPSSSPSDRQAPPAEPLFDAEMFPERDLPGGTRAGATSP